VTDVIFSAIVTIDHFSASIWKIVCRAVRHSNFQMFFFFFLLSFFPCLEPNSSSRDKFNGFCWILYSLTRRPRSYGISIMEKLRTDKTPAHQEVPSFFCWVFFFLSTFFRLICRMMRPPFRCILDSSSPFLFFPHLIRTCPEQSSLLFLLNQLYSGFLLPMLFPLRFFLFLPPQPMAARTSW